ncbi:acetyl/propionyl-CoA carboxylase subuit alpha [Sphaerisporangium melleum]|uniref:Acetyl/propionyl-CoA carboxylase subuit alpha n=1 Tax=Sphaerisporangium melleum TaxID=321316 RepID=A0A917QSW8_9ACTN|nr:biotin carboxylase N-terminal domain-containing protein [Sphaerisporangium melleum]GGK66882.1 acetyl/propionyl-CoA carboxylase subuit alpha [Sphaerisporangium melleum]GII68543.1 acetyl/propionyl-CoA carboxylase subuit alpha [Sphaerisporangium melleum]
MIRRLMVANRGEIARRVFRTCRELGVETVAVFAGDDADAPHVAEADHAVRLHGDRPAETYLDGAAVVVAALRAGADAVHPGYGFLSENAAFARAVLDAGLTWVGPGPDAIAAMGAKIEAKRLMAGAGVPVLPSLTFPAAVSEAEEDARGLTYPVLVKASAGGGGRGMRVVRDPDELAGAVQAAGREALAAFGDGTVFAEPLLEHARHVEVQIVADRHGTVWTLGERECSIQRRHQKVVEETPSPGISERVRATLLDAAVRAATAIGYVGAGTVEFLVAGDTVAFLEMNTRLQVEHPVTECVYGVDLVRLQLEIAEGVRLPAAPPAPSGHAIEVRLYAEDPARDWRPQSGTLHLLEIPGVDARFGRPPLERGLRLDSGVESGSVIGVRYDPMLAKVIAWGPERAAVARRLAGALARARIHGLTTNRDLLVSVLRHDAFLAGDTDTGFLTRHDLTAPPPRVPLFALAAALAAAAANRAAAPVLGGLPSGWRNVPSQPQRVAFDGPAGRVEVAYRLTRDGLSAEGLPDVRLVSAAPDLVVLEVDGVQARFTVASHPGEVDVDAPQGSVRLVPLPRLPEPVARVAPGSLLAPMPGTVLRVEVAAGARVAAGQPILILEAMKMEHSVRAPATGVVSALNVAPGRQVEAGAVLAVIEEPA